MSRGMGYKRKVRIKHIKRKSRIIKATWYGGSEVLHNETFRGRLDKGKVHCSCKMCAAKTNKDGFKPRDKREIERLEQSEKDIL